MKKIRSVKTNMLLNSIRGALGVLFPITTFPYVSRVLGVEVLGKYNFSQSVVSYFILIAGLGVTNYATRTGAQYRKDSEKYDIFASQVFSINVISTLISYLILIISILAIPKLQEYAILICILSTQIFSDNRSGMDIYFK